MHDTHLRDILISFHIIIFCINFFEMFYPAQIKLFLFLSYAECQVALKNFINQLPLVEFCGWDLTWVDCVKTGFLLRSQSSHVVWYDQRGGDSTKFKLLKSETRAPLTPSLSCGATRFYRAVTCTAVPTMARYLPTVPTVT